MHPKVCTCILINDKSCIAIPVAAIKTWLHALLCCTSNVTIMYIE
jgi:hypothetical protein